MYNDLPLPSLRVLYWQLVNPGYPRQAKSRSGPSQPDVGGYYGTIPWAPPMSPPCISTSFLPSLVRLAARPSRRNSTTCGIACDEAASKTRKHTIKKPN